MKITSLQTGRLLMLLWRQKQLTTKDKADCMKLFSIRQSNVPPKYQEIWMLEEAREDLAINTLRLNRVRISCLLPAFVSFLRSHLKLWFVLRAIESDLDSKNSL